MCDHVAALSRIAVFDGRLDMIMRPKWPPVDHYLVYLDSFLDDDASRNAVIPTPPKDLTEAALRLIHIKRMARSEMLRVPVAAAQHLQTGLPRPTLDPDVRLIASGARVLRRSDGCRGRHSSSAWRRVENDLVPLPQTFEEIPNRGCAACP